MVDLEVRPITRDELPRVEAALSDGGAAKHLDRMRRQERGEVTYLVAWLGEAPVGHVLLKWHGPLLGEQGVRIHRVPDLEDLFVLDEHRSRGVGGRLLDVAETLARERGFVRIGLGVALDNERALALYERRGYVDSGSGTYRIGGRLRRSDGSIEHWSEVCRYLVKELAEPADG